MRGKLFPLVLLALVACPLNASAGPQDDPCLNPDALPKYPTAFVKIGGDCTQIPAGVIVSLDHTESAYVLTVTFWAGAYGEDVVLTCSDPQQLVPKLGIPGRGPREYSPCWNDAVLA